MIYFTVMKLNWGLKTKPEQQKNNQSQKSALTDSFIRIDEQEGYAGKTEQSPTQDALAMCRALRYGKFPEYLAWLEQKPKKKIISKFRGVINSKSAGLPILDDEERPAVVLDGISFNPIQNIQGRMLTKITLLLLIETESRKLDIWGELQSLWTAQYIRETKKYVQILEVIAKQCENSGQKIKQTSCRTALI